MNRGLLLKIVVAILAGCTCLPLSATTWYVRKDGGTRYSKDMPKGQCDGQADAAYPGKGTNKHCAFNDVRFLWQDGSYTYGTAFPGWGWVIAGGDTVVIRGSIADGVSWRVGMNSPTQYCANNLCWGITSSPGASGAPPPPSGTAAQHTRILGGNFASCRSASARTQLHGGWGVGGVLNLSDASYVDVACLDITDFSACGRATQSVGCDATQDFANNGILFSNKSTHDTLTDVRIHGLAANGIYGPTGDGVVMDYVDILGNASSGWNADVGNGTTGVGSLLVEHYNITGNGCAEEYPIVDPLPYGDCTDQDHGGYGDGFGTATVDSHDPGWQVKFDYGTVSYNTQDGLDALHISGGKSSMTVSHTLAFGNMGQQIKVGGAAPIVTDNIITGNCAAMKEAIPGFPAGFNAKLSLFCRAGDVAVLINVPPDVPAVYRHNTMYTAGNIGLEVEYPGPETGKETIQYDHNIFVGFPGADGRYPTPIYSNSNLKMFTNPGASFSNNVTFRPRGNWTCPAKSLHEVNGSCSDPHLKDEAWHPYGHADISQAGTAGGSASNVEPPQPQSTSRVSIAVKSLGAVVLAAGLWKGARFIRNRASNT